MDQSIFHIDVLPSKTQQLLPSHAGVGQQRYYQALTRLRKQRDAALDRGDLRFGQRLGTALVNGRVLQSPVLRRVLGYQSVLDRAGQDFLQQTPIALQGLPGDRCAPLVQPRLDIA